MEISINTVYGKFELIVNYDLLIKELKKICYLTWLKIYEYPLLPKDFDINECKLLYNLEILKNEDIVGEKIKNHSILTFIDLRILVSPNIPATWTIGDIFETMESSFNWENEFNGHFHNFYLYIFNFIPQLKILNNTQIHDISNLILKNNS